MECLDDATVAVQLEPTLNKAIKKGEFFRRKSSTFYSRQKRIVWFVAGKGTPRCQLCTSYHQLFSPFQEPELVSYFAGIKKQGAGCIWDWPYPLMFQT